MALGLPVIVHSNFHKHMGPEPSYVEDGVNGLLFSRNDAQDLSDKIVKLSLDRGLRNNLANGALTTFVKLTTDSMGSQILKILEENS
ncbi:glycosyltransferase [Sodalis ligni]|uniref:glycosyltransferase n=1 Tax=Sodalis ligni TaxID=2697027 RepID=UPI001BDDCF1D|nr:glycosyltransferase [Sodalis ligni]